MGDFTAGIISFFQFILNSGFFSSSLFGTLLGSTISIATAFLVQGRAFRRAQLDRERSELERRRTLARSLLIKLISIYSDYATMFGHIEEAKEKVAHNQSWDLVSVLLPLAILPDKSSFQTDELTNLIEIKGASAFNQLMFVDRRFNQCIEAWRLFDIKKRKVVEGVGRKLYPETGILSMVVDAGSIAELDHYDVLKLVPDLVRFTEEGHSEAKELIGVLFSEFNLKLDLKLDWKDMKSPG